MDKVYLQKLTYSGTSVSKGDVKETVADFSVYLAEFPFIIMDGMKDVAKRDWYDEDGIDVFYDNGTPPLKDYDMDITCMAKADAVAELREKVSAFISYLRGDDGKGNVFAVYDTHCGAGRRNVRFVSVSQNAYYNIDMDDEKQLQFKVKLHVDDPRTEVTLVKGTDGETVTELGYEASPDPS